MFKINLKTTCLSIDTSGQFLSICLNYQEQYRLFHQEIGTKHSLYLIPTIKSLLEEFSISIQDIEVIIYAQGPGSFTGLRIGLAVAKGLAVPFNIPMIAIPTLDSVSYQLKDHVLNNSYIISAIDARMNEIYFSFYNNKLEIISPYHVGSWDTLQKIMKHNNIKSFIATGNAFLLEKNPFIHSILTYTEMPTALTLFKLAQTERYDLKEAKNADLLYIRNNIALTQDQQKELK